MASMSPVKPHVSMIILAAGRGARIGIPEVLLRMCDGTPLVAHHVAAMSSVLPRLSSFLAKRLAKLGV